MTAATPLAGARVLVTGGSGFIGTNAIDHFASLGCDVQNLDVRPPRKTTHARHWVGADILDHEAVLARFRAFRPDYLLHLAARTDLLETRRLEGYAANIEGVQHVLEAAESVGTVRRAIVASSRMVCRIGYIPSSDTDYCAPNLYGESKVRTERTTRARPWPFEWILVRPTSIWGPWFEVPYKVFFTSIQRRVYVNPSGHDPEKSFGFVGNTVFQLQRLLETTDGAIPGATLYLGDYPPLRLQAWAELIRREMGLPPIRTVPVAALRLGALAGDLLERVGLGPAPLTSFRLDNLLTPMVYPTAPLERVCGPLPYSLLEGVARTVAWMREP